MQDNRVSISIPQADLKKVVDAVKLVSDILNPFLVALTPDERQNLPKMSDGTLPFVQKALDYAMTNKQFVPAYIDLGELQIDVEATKVLLDIQRPLNQLTELLNDTVMLCGSEAYIASLGFYNSVKQASKMKVQGAEPVYKDLLHRFEGQGKKKNPPSGGDNHQ